MTTVLTIGTFDPFHAGHADLLNWCKLLGDKVVVGVLSDQFVERAKGRMPSFSQQDRLDFMIPLADDVYIERGRLGTPLSHPDRILVGDIDIVVVGGDWHTGDYHRRLGLSQSQLDTLGVTVAYVPRRLNISSTTIKRNNEA